MFGFIKNIRTGNKLLGVMSDFDSLFKVKTAKGSPSNIWGHKRTWELLSVMVLGVGALVAGDIKLFAFFEENIEIIAALAIALYTMFGRMRAKSDEGVMVAIESVAATTDPTPPAGTQDVDDPGRTPGASDGGGA